MPRKSFTIICLFVSFSLFAQKKITVDFSKQTGTIKKVSCVNKGPDNMVAAYKDAGIQLIRTHDYHDAFDYEYYTTFWNYDETEESYSHNKDFDPTNADHYDWTSTDEALKAMYDNNMQAYFRIGVSYPDNPKYRTPPLSAPVNSDGPGFDTFAEICKRTVMHCTSDWANGKNYGINYWEIWNEPGGAFWKGSPEQFYNMYLQVYDSMKAANPEIKIGTPGAVPTTTFGIDKEYREDLLAFLSEHKGKLDFYSWHLYAAKNPYGLKMWADTMRNLLDHYGFTEAENHISEINDELGEGLAELNESPKGTAYYMSNMLTAQEAPVDKIFWYQGPGFFNPDKNNKPDYIHSGYALKMFNLIRDNTPIEVSSTGNEVIDGFWQSDTTNFMVLAAKSIDENNLYIIISNYESDVSDATITIDNLPWKDSHNIKITRNIVKAGEVFTQFENTIKGAAQIEIPVENIQSPSALLLRIENDIMTGSTKKQIGDLLKIRPNPVSSDFIVISHPTITINRIMLYDMSGKRVKITENTHVGETRIELKEEPLPGIYLLRILTSKGEMLRKVSIH